MKNKQGDVLKKHHFWILFGLVPIFVLLAAVMITSGVGGEIEKVEGAIAKSESDIKSKSNPKPDKLISKMQDSIKFVDSKSKDLWEGSYQPQKNLYAMLDSPKLRPIERKKLRFGDKIPNDQDEYEEFKKREVYTARFAKMAESVAPTIFADGGWDKVLRHINTWTDVKLTSEQIWLLLEDIWVQDSLLQAVSSVNAQMAEFTRVKFEKNGQVIDDPADKSHQDPLRRKFRSRTWEIELEVVPKGNARILKGTLINITDKLQLMGVGNTMTLKVWLEPGDKKNVQPFDFKIGGESLAGEGATRIVRDKSGEREVKLNVLDIVTTDDHIIPPGMGVSEIVRVEQVFDGRTVPVRAIEKLELGFRDSRSAETPLKNPKFFPDEPAASTAASGGGGGSGNMPTGMGGGKMPPMSGPGGGSGGDNKGRTASGGGTVATVIDANKARYVEVTDQVRRMPVGVVVITDQSFMQDVLLAFANSPLRFQITQVTWNRYRGLLGSGSEPGSSGGSGGGSSGSGNSGIVTSGPGRLGDGLGSGSGPGKRPPMSGGGPGGLPPFGSGGSNSGGSSSVSEAQLTSGLIELKIYGIVSLYTSPETPVVETPPVDPKDPKKDAATADPKKEKDKDPNAKEKDKAPAQKDPAGKEGLPKDSSGKDPAGKDLPGKDAVPKEQPGTDPKSPKK